MTADQAIVAESLAGPWFEAIPYDGELYWIHTTWTGRQIDVGES